MERPGIAIIDIGGQLTWNIRERLTKNGVYTETFRPEEVAADDLGEAQGIIMSGGPHSVYGEESPRFAPRLADGDLADVDVPVLGICYGLQDLADAFGGDVPDTADSGGEYGEAELTIDEHGDLFDGVEADAVTVWMSHGDFVTALPDGWEVLARTDDCPTAAARHDDRQLYGVQFHPEAEHTEAGDAMLTSFARICGVDQTTWSLADYLDEQLERIPEHVGDRHVVHLTSGGVDSTVAAVMLQEALPAEQYTFLYMDPGIMRQGETDRVVDMLRQAGIEPQVLDTRAELEQELAGDDPVADPEEKRDIIGTHFVRMAERYAEAADHIDGDWVLSQGTIWPDHIESQGSQHADRIKTHHNRVEEVERLLDEDRVVEPLQHLFKDDVRALAEILEERYLEEGALTAVIAGRHPFPGPGLGIRTLCCDGEAPDLSEVEEQVQDVVAAERDALGKTAIEARMLPVRTVGQQGDARTYTHPALLYGPFPGWDALDGLSRAITNQLGDQVNRVVYAWRPQEAETVEAREAYVTQERMDRLRAVDAAAMEELEAPVTAEHLQGVADRAIDELDAVEPGEDTWMDVLGQCPVISLPVTLNGDGTDAVAIRPIHTTQFMTGTFGRLPRDMVDRVAAAAEQNGFSGLLYDVTNKPPGTIEWE